MSEEQALQNIVTMISGHGGGINTQLVETNRLLQLLIRTQATNGMLELVRLLGEKRISNEHYLEFVNIYKGLIKETIGD